MLPSFRLAATLSLLCVIFPLSAAAQTPVALPYTMTTLAGQSPMTAVAGTQCPNLPAGVKSTDAYGDGCLAVNGIFGTAVYSGVVADSLGNVFVTDDVNGVLHKINLATGIMTLVAGGGTACTANKLDSSGDGCVAATGTAGVTGTTGTAGVASQRSVGIDPYGNIVLGGYNDHLVHMICLNASPLCGSGTPLLLVPYSP